MGLVTSVPTLPLRTSQALLTGLLESGVTSFACPLSRFKLERHCRLESFARALRKLRVGILPGVSRQASQIWRGAMDVMLAPKCWDMELPVNPSPRIGWQELEGCSACNLMILMGLVAVISFHLACFVRLFAFIIRWPVARFCCRASASKVCKLTHICHEHPYSFLASASASFCILGRAEAGKVPCHV